MGPMILILPGHFGNVQDGELGLVGDERGRHLIELATVVVDDRPGRGEVVERGVQAGLGQCQDVLLLDPFAHQVDVLLDGAGGLDRLHPGIGPGDQPDLAGEGRFGKFQHLRAPGELGEPVGDQVALDRHAFAQHGMAVDGGDLLPDQILDHGSPVGLHVLVADPEVLGEPLDQLHLHAVIAAGDEIGVGDAQMTDHAIGLDAGQIPGVHGSQSDTQC